MIEVAYLSSEARMRLLSDFGNLADILCRFQQTGELPASNRSVSHPRELAAAVKAITGVEIDFNTDKDGEITMISTVQKYRQSLMDEARSGLLTELFDLDTTSESGKNDALTNVSGIPYSKKSSHQPEKSSS